MEKASVGRDFEGRRVLVTGGSGGLGRAVVGALLGRGAQVTVPVHDARELEGWDAGAAQVAAGVDLRDETSVERLFEGLSDLWASVHLVGGFSMGSLVGTSADDLRHMLELNTLTCFLTMRGAARKMVAGGRGGRIVNVAARPALTPTGGLIAYAASKAAVVSLTESAAQELRADGVWVNAVAPSIMDTPANRAAMPDADHGSWPRVEEVANAIAFLASPENALTTGLIMPVYGRV